MKNFFVAVSLFSLTCKLQMSQDFIFFIFLLDKTSVFSPFVKLVFLNKIYFIYLAMMHNEAVAAEMVIYATYVSWIEEGVFECK